MHALTLQHYRRIVNKIVRQEEAMQDRRMANSCKALHKRLQRCFVNRSTLNDFNRRILQTSPTCTADMYIFYMICCQQLTHLGLEQEACSWVLTLGMSLENNRHAQLYRSLY